MAIVPGWPLFPVGYQFTDSDGDPLALGSIQTFEAGTSTPLETWSDVDLVTANATTLDLNADGRLDVLCFGGATAYKIAVFDANDVEQPYSPVDDYGNPGFVFADTFGVLLAEGAKNEAGGHIQEQTDRFITFDQAIAVGNPANYTLLPASDYTAPETIQNWNTATLAVSPHGSDTIDGQSGVGALGVPPSDGTVHPVAQLLPDGVNAWYLASNPFMQTTYVAFASLDVTPVRGMVRGITDASTNTWGATIAGGGANVVLAQYNGSNWTVIGK